MWERRPADIRRLLPAWALSLSLGPGLAWIAASAFLAPNGYLTEAVGANVFVVRDGAVLSPDAGCLEGITRQSVFDLCSELGIPSKATRVHSDELGGADEVFLTTTAGSVMPVRTVDGELVAGRDGPGPISVRLHNQYWERRWDGWHATPVRYELAG